MKSLTQEKPPNKQRKLLVQCILGRPMYRWKQNQQFVKIQITYMKKEVYDFKKQKNSYKFTVIVDL